MPRINKFEDQLAEKPKFAGKIFMYISYDWNILFPLVDIIRLFKPNTIISYRIGKKQELIREYGTQYYHRVYGTTIETRKDYIEALNKVLCMFLFTNGSDSIATNLMNVAEKGNILLICYSTVDSLYHIYNGLEKTSYKDPLQVIRKMYTVLDFLEVKKINELFPEFDILETTQPVVENKLDECVEILKKTSLSEKKKKDLNNVILFDPHSAKLKKMEYQREQKKIENEFNKSERPSRTFNILDRFLKKN